MVKPKIRKQELVIDRIWHDGGEARPQPITRVIAAAVTENPFAGGYVDDIAWFMDELEPLAQSLVDELMEFMTGRTLPIESFGKAAMCGEDGEDEHAAMWHAPAGAVLRREIPGVKAGVPGLHTVGHQGERLDLPLGCIFGRNVRSHYDSMGLVISDAPRRNELLLAVGVSTGGRARSRLGGVTVEEALSA
ncbi:amino acid synthesis family protein [Actinomadura macra]|uniref:amino acid synthesis family protein n=1 Tax=Actinomadura macra TaxID=46164 RepID=UPI00082E2472|nr:amino acid synthesis family protein [Actinomadura macra]